METKSKDASASDMKKFSTYRPWLMGQVAGSIQDIKPAKEIMDEMVNGAIEIFRRQSANVVPVAKL